MKLYKKIIYFSIFGFISLTACYKDPVPETATDVYIWASLDENGGRWDPVFIDNTDFPVATPTEVTSAEYLAELQALKNTTSALTTSQREAIRYWDGNALTRWNEIARELAAKYNLPPAANPDGTYPAPNAANPGVYPLFPFANPPYTARMFAYWSAAQYDALIACWRYKAQYKRPAPYVVDKSIAMLLPTNTLPSYPSEDAVIAAVSERILIAMFPNDADLIRQKGQEHRDSRLWAGANVPSDLAAGDALGRSVAQLFLDRARTDGMSKAGGSAAIQDSLGRSAQQRFGWQWKSLETPARLGMLMLYGRVKPWCIPNAAAVRPGPPPALGSTQFTAEVDELRGQTDNLSTEKRRIANYWSDGPSTYTPPGHWNRIGSDLIVAARQNPLRSARTFAYMNMSVMDAGISCWDTKYYYMAPRPSQVDPAIKTILGVPNFPSYTSGHSTFSYAAATVLGHIFPAAAADLDKKAEEASLSRIYGNIHFRADCETGRDVGRKIAGYSIVVARVDGAE